MSRIKKGQVDFRKDWHYRPVHTDLNLISLDDLRRLKGDEIRKLPITGVIAGRTWPPAAVLVPYETYLTVQGVLRRAEGISAK